MRHFFIFWLLTLPAFMAAQREALIRSETDTLVFELGEKEGRLALMERPSAFSGSSVRNALRINYALRLNDADLVLEFNLAPPPEKGFFYRTKVVFVDYENPAQKSSGLTMEEVLEIRDAPYNGKPWILPDATEHYLEYNRPYSLIMTTELWGNIACSNTRPAFSVNQQWPHYAAAGIGIGLVGIGQIYRQQKKDAYNNYRDFWVKRLPETEAQPFLDQAKKKDNTTKALTYSGWAILGLDAGILAYRWLRIKKQQRKFDLYCSPESLSIQIKPKLEFAPGELAPTPVFAFTLKF